MRHQGKITTWKDDQGFGFITPNLGGEPDFVHIKAFAKRQGRPAANQIVTYEIASDANGRLQARHVAPVGTPRRTAENISGPSRLPLFIAGLFLLFVAIGALTARLPPSLFFFYAGASLLTFIAYAIDKSAARSGRWRTPENTLHLLALCGGWPGALIAQHQLRHKSRKASFLVVFWTTSLLNCGSLGWLFTQSGKPVLQALLH